MHYPGDVIVGSLIFFIIILIFFWRLVLPRMKKMLDERAEAIEGNIAKADEAQHKAEALLEEYTAQLADARAEAGKIREAARTDGQKIVAEAKETAQSEAARVTAAAQAQIEAERQAALVSLRGEVGSLAIDLASGVVSREHPGPLELPETWEGSRQSGPEEQPGRSAPLEWQSSLGLSSGLLGAGSFSSHLLLRPDGKVQIVTRTEIGAAGSFKFHLLEDTGVDLKVVDGRLKGTATADVNGEKREGKVDVGRAK